MRIILNCAIASCMGFSTLNAFAQQQVIRQRSKSGRPVANQAQDEQPQGEGVDPNLRWHKGRWWYWQNDHWLMWNGSRWRTYTRRPSPSVLQGIAADRRITGEARPPREFDAILDGDTRFSGDVFPFETEYYGYPTPFEDSGDPGAYQRPFAPEHNYRFDGDNYGYGGYDYGHGDIGYRESLTRDPQVREP